MKSKADDAFKTISEVALEIGVPKHVLRFWETRFPQLKPMKRGGGRRYYRPEDLALLTGIRRLLHSDGYTIKGVQKIMREQGVETVKQAGTQHDVQKTDPIRTARTPRGQKNERSNKKVAASAPCENTASPLARATKTQDFDVATAIKELEACRALLSSMRKPIRPSRSRKSSASPRVQASAGR